MDETSLVPAALVFVRELDEAYPNRSRVSDGSVASSAHHAGNPTSDHEHGTPQPGDRDIDAVDITRELIPGDLAASDAAMYGDVLPAFQRKHRAQYAIFKDQIAFADEGWRWRSYAYAGPGRSRHMEHAHCNWREDSASHNDTSPYGIEGEDMPTPADLLAYDPGIDPKTKKAKRGGIPNPDPTTVKDNPTLTPATALYRAVQTHELVTYLVAEIKALRADVTALKAAK
jgi:hypothetical protein